MKLFLLSISLVFSQACLAGINKPCLNSDAEALARLSLYDLKKDPNILSPADTGGELRGTTATSDSASINDLSALTSAQLPKSKLTDWDSWPVRHLTYGNMSADFLGIQLTNKTGAGMLPRTPVQDR